MQSTQRSYIGGGTNGSMHHTQELHGGLARASFCN